jgi:hypothetical protein
MVASISDEVLLLRRRYGLGAFTGKDPSDRERTMRKRLMCANHNVLISMTGSSRFLASLPNSSVTS